MLNNIPNGWRPAITKLGVISLLAFCIFFTWSAAAEVFKLESHWTCGETVQLTNELKAEGEEIVIVGTMDDDALLFTLWSNPKTRTFTAVATIKAKPEMSCIIVHGQKLITPTPKNMI